jgi:hypothetical protein
MMLISGFIAGKIIDLLFDSSTPEWELYVWASGYLMLLLIMTSSFNYANMKLQVVAAGMKGTALRFIYSKVLSLQHD